MEDTQLINLVRQAQAGSREAFGELVRSHEPAVFGIVLRRLRNRAEACEVTQEVFLRALRKLDTVVLGAADSGPSHVAIAPDGRTALVTRDGDHTISVLAIDADKVTYAHQDLGAGLKPYGTHHAHGLHSPYWWLKCAFGVDNDKALPVRAYHKLLVWDIMKRPLATRLAEQALNPLIGKSFVAYATKPHLPRVSEAAAK